MSRTRRRRRPLVTSLGLFVGGFLFLLGAATAAVLAQFLSTRTAPMVSIGYSFCAVVFTVASILKRDHS